jgi:DNA repair exonuclease SbcCD ATPase subunit
MRIRLIGFRKYTDTTLEFPDNMISYLCGENGTGKSTIFAAILWTLYGKVRKVSHSRTPNSRVTVWLAIDNLVIMRQRKPKSLLVTIDCTTTIEGNVAQEYINSQYGQMSTWIATCYLQQDHYHPLVENDPSSRMKLLNQIAFDGDDPAEKISKLSSAIREYEKYTAVASAESSSSYNAYVYTSNMERIDPTWSIIDQQTTYQLRNELASLGKRVSDLQAELTTSNFLIGKFEAYENIVRSSGAKMLALGDYNSLIRQRDELERDFRDYTLAEEVNSRYRNLRQQLSSLMAGHDRNTEPICGAFTHQQVVELSNQWQSYNKNFTAFQQLGVSGHYSEDAIKTEISRLERNRDSQWIFNTATRYNQLSAKVAYLKENITEKPKQSLEDCRTDLDKLTKEYSENLQSENSLRAEFKSKHDARMAEISRKVAVEKDTLNSLLRSEFTEKKAQLTTEYDEKILRLRDDEMAVVKSLSELQASQHIYSCPSCAVAFRVVGNKAELSDKTPYNHEKNAELLESQSVIRKSIADTQREKSTKISQLELEYSQLLRVRLGEIDSKRAEETEAVAKERRVFEAESSERAAKQSSEYEFSRKELTDAINNHARHSAQSREISSLEEELSSLSTKTADIPEGVEQLTPYQLTLLNTRIVSLSQIKVCEKPTVTVEDATTSMRWHQRQSQIEKLEAELEKISPVENVKVVTEQQIRDVRSKISSLEQLRTQLESTTIELEKLGTKPNIQEIQRQLASAQARTSEISEMLRRSESVSKVKNAYEYALGKHNEFLRISKKLANIIEMKDIAIRTQADVHYKIITAINNFLAVISPIMFDEPISISIGTNRQTKTGAEVSCVNLQISYNGDDDFSLDCMSGGEKRYISTIISLAFSCIFGGKMMILDESMACLSPNKRDAMVKIIRETVPDRTVIVTCHGIQKGLFDYVVDV